MGKLLGALFGYLIGGFVGLVIGLLLGHWFDRGLARRAFGGARVAEVHRVFFRASFSVMGHVAKADGHVSEAEVAAAERIMARMRLGAEQRREAIEYFRQGKRSDFDLDATLLEFRRVCGRQLNLVRVFMEIQLQAALADGTISENEREVLLRIARGLGLSQADYERLEALLMGGWRRAQGQQRPDVDTLAEAYRELGVSAEASDAEVKRAYRKLMSEHHPDKLVSRGMPEEMVDMAKERTQQIQGAYDAIRRARGQK